MRKGHFAFANSRILRFAPYANAKYFHTSGPKCLIDPSLGSPVILHVTSVEATLNDATAVRPIRLPCEVWKAVGDSHSQQLFLSCIISSFHSHRLYIVKKYPIIQTSTLFFA